MNSGGGLTRTLNELEESGFITRYIPYKKRTRDSFYRLSDFYTSFYHRFISEQSKSDPGFWINSLDSPRYRAWSGYAFEQICLEHLPQIKKSLGIEGVYSESGSWRGESDNTRTQIDLLIDRRDRVINICEIKFAETPFRITKSYYSQLQDKLRIFREATGTRKALFLTMITTYGLVSNEYASNVQMSLQMDALFSK